MANSTYGQQETWVDILAQTFACKLKLWDFGGDSQVGADKPRKASRTTTQLEGGKKVTFDLATAGIGGIATSTGFTAPDEPDGRRAVECLTETWRTNLMRGRQVRPASGHVSE